MEDKVCFKERRAQKNPRDKLPKVTTPEAHKFKSAVDRRAGRRGDHHGGPQTLSSPELQSAAGNHIEQRA